MLPDEVREAVERMDTLATASMRPATWQTIRARLVELEAENKILRVKCAGSLANNLCPDHRDKQTGKPCIACTIEKLEKRAERAEALLRDSAEALLPHAAALFGDPNRAQIVYSRITAHLSENGHDHG